MSDAIKAFAAVIGGILSLLVLAFVLQYAGLISLGFFGPKYQAIKRDIYTQSPSYVLGNQADLEHQARAYREATDPETKAVILSGLHATVDNLGNEFPIPADVEQILDNPNSN